MMDKSEYQFSKNTDINIIIDKMYNLYSSITDKIPTSYFLTQYMQIIMDIDYVNSISVFLFSRIDHDIYLFKKLPENYINIIDIDALIDEGIIAETIALAKVIPYNNNMLLIPFLSVDGINGIAVITLDLSVELLENRIVKLLYIGAHNIGNTLGYFYKAEDEKKSREVADQIIASKTLELIEDKNKLHNRITELTTNLSMVIPHEIRTPINQILGSTNILKKYLKVIDNEQITDFYELLDDIESSTQRLKRITENYIYYANLIIISFNIEELQKLQKYYIEGADSIVFEVVMNKAMSYNREQDVEFSLVEASLQIDEIYFIKIIEEIIDNAFKFSGHGTHIAVKSEIQDNYYKIVISDKGKGLSREEIKSINPYLQHNRSVIEQQGSGLGLSIVYKLISIHSGKITINSEPGLFTEVTLSLPLADLDTIINL